MNLFLYNKLSLKLALEIDLSFLNKPTKKALLHLILMWFLRQKKSWLVSYLLNRSCIMLNNQITQTNLS